MFPTSRKYRVQRLWWHLNQPYLGLIFSIILYSRPSKLVRSWPSIPDNLILKMHLFCMGYSILEDSCHVFQVITISVIHGWPSTMRPNNGTRNQTTESELFFRTENIEGFEPISIFRSWESTFPLKPGNHCGMGMAIMRTKAILNATVRYLAQDFISKLRLTIQREPVTPKRQRLIERPHQDRETQIAQAYRRSLLSYRPPGSKAT